MPKTPKSVKLPQFNYAGYMVVRESATFPGQLGALLHGSFLCNCAGDIEGGWGRIMGSGNYADPLSASV